MLGNAVTNLFFHHRVNQLWKDKYIKALVSLSGIYAGAGLPLYSMVSLSNSVLTHEWPVCGLTSKVNEYSNHSVYSNQPTMSVVCGLAKWTSIPIVTCITINWSTENSSRWSGFIGIVNRLFQNIFERLLIIRNGPEWNEPTPCYSIFYQVVYRHCLWTNVYNLLHLKFLCAGSFWN